MTTRRNQELLAAGTSHTAGSTIILTDAGESNLSVRSSSRPYSPSQMMIYAGRGAGLSMAGGRPAEVVATAAADRPEAPVRPDEHKLEVSVESLYRQYGCAGVALGRAAARSDR